MLDDSATAATTAVAPPTGPAIDIDPSFFAQLEQSAPTEDPRMVRWGYNPGQRGITMRPLETGLRDMFIPFGTFIPHTTFRTPRENCTLDEYKDKEYYVDVTAAEVQANFERVLGFDHADKRNWGYKCFGYGETNAVKMAGMNQILIPTLQKIREMFDDEAIAAYCKGEDEMDLGDARTHCASCHLDWIKSDAVQVLMQDAAATGRTLAVRRPDGNVVPVHVKFTYAELEELRQIVQSGLELYKRQAHADWSTLLNEHENGLRDQILESEHFLRKDLHEPRPQNKDAALIAKVIEAQGRQPQQAAPVADNSGVIEKLAQGQVMMQESMAKTNEILAQMALNQQQQQAATPAAVTPAEAAPEEKTAAPKTKK